MTFDDFLHFSFATITTVGYGDIVPMTPRARVLSSLEAVVGTFYVATLVARLASNYRSEDLRRDEAGMGEE